MAKYLPLILRLEKLLGEDVIDYVTDRSDSYRLNHITFLAEDPDVREDDQSIPYDLQFRCLSGNYIEMEIDTDGKRKWVKRLYSNTDKRKELLGLVLHPALRKNISFRQVVEAGGLLRSLMNLRHTVKQHVDEMVFGKVKHAQFYYTIDGNEFTFCCQVDDVKCCTIDIILDQCHYGRVTYKHFNGATAVGHLSVYHSAVDKPYPSTTMSWNKTERVCREVELIVQRCSHKLMAVLEFGLDWDTTYDEYTSSYTKGMNHYY